MLVMLKTATLHLV